MSEYQYYEFQAIDRPLDEADRRALRAISTRARITATRFTNSYESGDFKGDPAKLMERWFDLHLYLANWGSRQLMIRLPKRLTDRSLLDRFLGEVDCVTMRVAGENLILNIVREEIELEDWDDGDCRLAELAPLRADVLGGDLRLFYLLWLTAVEADVFEPDEPEPMPGIGPMTASLAAFVDFFGIDPDLVAAAAERSALPVSDTASPGVVQKIISAMNDGEKTTMLARLFDGDPHITAELRAKVRDHMASQSGARPLALRTAGELRARAHAIGLAREHAEAEKRATERKRQDEEAEKTRRSRLNAIAQRGESVWREIEAKIERQNKTGYDKAVNLLHDLRAVAEERGTAADFARHLKAIRERHIRKRALIARLAGITS